MHAPLMKMFFLSFFPLIVATTFTAVPYLVVLSALQLGLVAIFSGIAANLVGAVASIVPSTVVQGTVLCTH